MFVIERLFIEDKNLAKVLTVLAGLVLNMEPPKPVTVKTTARQEGQPKLGRPKGPVRESRKATLVTWLKEQQGKEITRTQLISKLVELGGSELTMNGMVGQLVQEKVLERKGTGIYLAL